MKVNDFKLSRGHLQKPSYLEEENLGEWQTSSKPEAGSLLRMWANYKKPFFSKPWRYRVGLWQQPHWFRCSVTFLPSPEVAFILHTAANNNIQVQRPKNNWGFSAQCLQNAKGAVK